MRLPDGAPRPDPWHSRIPGALLIVGAALSFSFTGLFAKKLPEIDPAQLVVLRSGFMVVVLGVWAKLRGDPLFVWKRREGILLLLRGLLGTIGFLLFFGSLQRIPLADTVILFQAHPLVVAALGPWLLHERTRGVQWLLLALCLAGVGLVVGPSLEGDLVGRLMALGCALVAGIAYTLVRILTAVRVPALTIALAFPMVAVTVVGPLVSIGLPGFGWVDPAPGDWWWILGVAAASTAGQILLTLGIGRVPAARGSAFMNTQVIFAATWGILWLGEIPTWNAVAGAVVVVTGLYLLNRSRADEGGSGGRRRRLPWFVSVPVAVTVVVILFLVLGMRFIENMLIYHPEVTPRESSTRIVEGVEVSDVRFRAEDGVELHGWIAGPMDGPVVIFCHGNAGNITHRGAYVSGWVRQGLSILVFDYRGYGQSAGSPDEQGLYADARAAHRHLTEEIGVDEEDIVLHGRSLGGAVCTHLATERPVGRLIVESSFTSVRDMARDMFGPLPVHLLASDGYASIEKVQHITIPKLFLHGDRDDLVPFEMGVRLEERAAPPSRFVRLEGVDHNDAPFVMGETYFEILARFARGLDDE